MGGGVKEKKRQRTNPGLTQNPMHVVVRSLSQAYVEGATTLQL